MSRRAFHVVDAAGDLVVIGYHRHHDAQLEADRWNQRAELAGRAHRWVRAGAPYNVKEQP